MRETACYSAVRDYWKGECSKKKTLVRISKNSLQNVIKMWLIVYVSAECNVYDYLWNETDLGILDLTVSWWASPILAYKSFHQAYITIVSTSEIMLQENK